MAYGAAMASLAIEAFSPARLIAAQGSEIEDRVSALHRMVEFRLESLSE
jgi:hypothetical protein